MGRTGERHTRYCEVCRRRRPLAGGTLVGGRGGAFVCAGRCRQLLERAMRDAQLDVFSSENVNDPEDPMEADP